jgi:PAS domain S-box-containing protein
MTEPRKASVPASMLPELCYSLMERSPIPVIELEGPGHIIRYVNPAFCRLVRKNADALTGKSFTETVQEGDRCVTVLTRVYRTGESETHTGSDQIDPHPFIWSYAIWPVLDATQRPVGLMMQITETTLFHQQAVE